MSWLSSQFGSKSEKQGRMADLCSNVDLVLAHCMIQSIFYIYLGSFIIIFENDCTWSIGG